MGVRFGVKYASLDEPVSERRTEVGSVSGDRFMNNTTPSTITASSSTKRVRRQYDAAFKQSAVAECQRHGGAAASLPMRTRF